MGIDVSKKGAIVEGRADRVLDNILEFSNEEVAQKAHDRIKQIMGASFKNPTGYYESRVTVDRTSDSSVLSDNGVVYGPWLEGNGSRNGSSRFKGYHMFRRTMQEMEKTAENIVESTVGRNMGRLQ